MSVFLGEKLKIEIYGGSHEKEIGVVISGIPGGTVLDLDKLSAFMSRRAPGRDEYSTPRKESDAIEFLSGVSKDGKCVGGDIHAVIRSNNTRSGDYSAFSDTPRPSHADYVASVKYKGKVNMAGGGPFSGRMTAPLCIAGGICLQLLERIGISIGAHLYSVADIKDSPFESVHLSSDELCSPAKKAFPVIDDTAGEKMKTRILDAKSAGDSVGAIVECAAVGLPAGIGGPLFEGIESRISAIAFAVPAVKGVEFGSGFSSAEMTGSAHNDPFCIEDGKVRTKTNNSGGIQGGITNGMPLIFRAALKPTPSIRTEQETVSLSKMCQEKLSIGGRHDPCVGVRAVPVIEAVAAIALFDAIQDNER